ncbi:hypothetical protein V6N12_010299 [Hibiscus sabdariffa]|uniref:Uncharacterized protein n=1 Tax=Hibiscus sabdariffa TaxID=183260 RepID=A0ABR2AAY3_9ROSI
MWQLRIQSEKKLSSIVHLSMKQVAMQMHPLCFVFSYLTVCVMGIGIEPLMAAEAGEIVCWFFWDFPGLLASDLVPGCRTFTPRINCDEIHFIVYFSTRPHMLIKISGEIVLTYLPHFTSEYMTMKSPSWSPFALTKSPGFA